MHGQPHIKLLLLLCLVVETCIHVAVYFFQLPSVYLSPKCIRSLCLYRVTYLIEEEIKGRIYLGNKAFYANQDLFKSELLTKNSKLRVYKTLVRPAVPYACETWVLKENIKPKLRVFERKVLRRIYGPTKEKDDTWRINLYAPCILYIGQSYRYSPGGAFYIFSQQIYLIFF